MSRRKAWLFGGRVALYVEPRDAWIGAYIGDDDYVYVCPLPCLVIRWARCMCTQCRSVQCGGS